jgi:uncharacterized protein (DUF1499 family)
MKLVISLFLLLSVILSANLTVIPPALANSAINQPKILAALPLVSNLFRGSVPANLGVKNLSPCPASPNCVVSQNGDKTHAIAPIPYQGSPEQAKETLLKVLSVVPRTEIIEQSDDYIQAESSSKLLGFVDDVEFYFPKDAKIIEVRSASRLGDSDLGVNRRRIEQIRLAMKDLGV